MKTASPTWAELLRESERLAKRIVRTSKAKRRALELRLIGLCELRKSIVDSGRAA